MPKYIDADNLKTILEERRDMARKLYGNLGGAVNGCIKLLDQQPAADVEPKRKPGKWVYDMNQYYKCTACNFYTYIPDNGSAYIPDYEDYLFCPHCGANMEEEE